LTTFSTTGSYSTGLQNGDEAKVSQALMIRTSTLPKTAAVLNASNVYDAGLYEASKTGSAEALGYAGVNPLITVTKAPLAITVKSASKTYDAGLYSGGAGLTYSGFVGTETATALGGKVVYGGAAQGAVNAGTYALSASGLTAKNYALAYTAGTLTIAPKPLTIRVNDDARFVGQTDAVGYNGASYTGFVPGQSISNLGALSISRTSSTSAPGNYTGVLQASIAGLTNSNYAITYVPGSYTIVPADQLLVKFANVATTYGADPVYSVTSAQYLKSSTNTVIDLTPRASLAGSTFSLTDGDGGATSFAMGPQATTLSSAGKLNAYGGYQLTASSITNSSTNYKNTITTTGALTVNPLAISVAASSGLAKTYDGSADMKGLGLTLTGVLGVDQVSVTGQGAYSSANAASTNYAVNNLVLGGLDKGNYVLSAGSSISGTNGSISKASLTVTAKSDLKLYDGLEYLGGNGVVYSGFVNNESEAVLGGTLAYAGDSQNAVNAGSYTITPQGLSSINYNLGYVSAPLTVAPVTITTKPIYGELQGPIAKVYDGSDSATLSSANYILTGWVSTDMATVSKTTGTYDNANVGSGKMVTVSLTAGDYVAGVATNLSNYVLPTSITGAVGAITPKPVTVAGLAAAGKTYDGNSSVLITNWGTVATGVANESLTLLSGAASFSDAAALSGKTVTASGFSLADGTGGVASNYMLTSSSSTTTASIAQKAVTVTSLARTSTYDGSTYADLTSNTGFVSTALAQGDWVASVTKVASGAGVAPNGTGQAGSYTVTPSAATMGSGLAGNYIFSYVASTNTVDKAHLKVTANDASKNYDAQAYSGGNGVSYTGLVVGESANVLGGTLVYAGSAQGALNAGTYAIAPQGLSSSNYNITYVNGVLTVNPATVSVTPISGALRGTVSKVYNGTDVATLSSENYLLTGWASGEGATVSKTTGTYDNANAGSGKTVTVSLVTGDYVPTGSTSLSNYTLPSTISGAVGQISKAPLTVTATAVSKTYDGTTTATGSGSVGTLAGARDAVNAAGSQAFTNKNAGTGNKVVRASGVTIKDALNADMTGNYDISYVDHTASTINKAALTVTATAVTKTYDGTTTATGSASVGTLAGVGDAVNAAGSQAFTNKNAGTGNKVVQASGVTIKDALNADMTGNYDISYVDHTASTINKAPLTVAATAVSKTYDGTTTATGSASVGTLAGAGDAVNAAGSQAFTNKNAGMGNKTVQASGVTIKDALNADMTGNYDISYVDHTASTINKAALTVTATAVTKTYDGTTTATGSASVGTLAGAGDAVNAAGSQAFTNKNAGTGNKTVQASGVTIKDALNADMTGNYDISYVDHTASTINKAALTVTATAVTKTYDGTTTATGSASVGTLAGAGDAVNAAGSQAFTNKNAGTGNKTVQASGVTIKDALNADMTGNYDISYVDHTASTINKAALTVTATAVTKTYDGTTTATGSASVGTLAGVGDAVNAAGSQAFTNKNAGTGNKTVQASGVTIKDALNADMTGNYDISYVDHTASTINKAALTVTATAVTKTYDGTTTATGSASVGTLAGAGDAVNAAGSQAFTNKNAGTGNKTVQASGVTIKDALNADMTGNYDISYVDQTASTIHKAPLTARGHSAQVTYNGANQTVSGFTVSGLQGTDTESMLTSVSSTGATAKNAGSYTNTVTAGTETNYTVSTFNGSLDIAKAALTARAHSAQVTYKGADQTVSGYTVSGLQGNDTVGGLTGLSASGATGFTVGSYANTMSVVDQANYTVTGVNGSLLIVAAPITAISGALQGAVSKVYDSTTTATLDSNNYLLTGWLGTDKATVTKTTGTFDNANAGNAKTVTVSLLPSDFQAMGVTDLSNYELPTRISGAVGQINKATVTPSITASDKVYDTTAVANGRVGLTGVHAADTLAATAAAASYSFANPNVGAGKSVTATGITLSSGLASNYVLSSNTATGVASITPAPLTVTAINAAKFVTQADSLAYEGYAVTGLLGSQTAASAGISAGVSLSRSNTGVDLAGVYPGVLVPSGNATIGNYAVRYAPGTYTIVPAGQLMVETTSTNSTYGTAGQNPIARVSYLDAVSRAISQLSLSGQTVVNGATVYTYTDGASGTVSFSSSAAGFTRSASGQVNVGSYGQVAGNFSKTTNNLQSNTATVTGNLTVQPLAITVSAKPATTTYNSSVQRQADTHGVLAADAVTVSGAVSQRNAGIYTSALMARGADVGNYSISYENSNFTIDRAVLATTVSASNKVYDGSTFVNLNLTDNRFSGDALSVTARGQFADKNVGTAKSVAIVGLTLSGPDANNYSLSAPANTTATISPLPQVAWVGGTTGNWFDPGNWAGGAVPDLANVVKVNIPAGVTVEGAPSGMFVAAPAVLTPKVEQAPWPYEVTLVQLPQGDAGGQVHIELQNATADARIALPAAVKDWIAAAGSALELDGLTVSQVDGLDLIDDGAALSLKASLNRSIPLEFVMRGVRERMTVRIVWKP
jgi:trimeric autotransporter adhesin